ncbi:hypothetical protein [Paenibacillus sp. CCS19]|uniref:hypothetical protein n=1 Tax=Paenibacillus sp. CCS19 TaxID=3158387 RepID=UPI00295EE9D3|nr:hypothetical protein [Paenibacillus cellulosilyticus]
MKPKSRFRHKRRTIVKRKVCPVSPQTFRSKLANTSNPVAAQTSNSSSDSNDTHTITSAAANASNPISASTSNPNDVHSSIPVTSIATSPTDANTSNPVATNTNTNTVSPTINVNPVININSTAAGQGLLTEFNFVPLDFNSTESPVPNTVLNTTPLLLSIDDTTGRVWLNFSVQWASTQPVSEVIFRIQRRRQGEVAFTDICTTIDTKFTNILTTTLTCVDAESILTPGQQPVEYQVTAEAADGLPVLIFFGIGTFTGAVIEANN